MFRIHPLLPLVDRGWSLHLLLKLFAQFFEVFKVEVFLWHFYHLLELFLDSECLFGAAEQASYDFSSLLHLCVDCGNFVTIKDSFVLHEPVFDA